MCQARKRDITILRRVQKHIQNIIMKMCAVSLKIMREHYTSADLSLNSNGMYTEWMECIITANGESYSGYKNTEIFFWVKMRGSV